MNFRPVIIDPTTKRMIELTGGNNVLTPWSMVRNRVFAGERVTVPNNYTLTIPSKLTIDAEGYVQIGQDAELRIGV